MIIVAKTIIVEVKLLKSKYEEDGLLRRKENDSGRVGSGAIHARRKSDYQRLDDVLAYCEETACLQSRIPRYFGETPAQGHRCGNCSTCFVVIRTIFSVSGKMAGITNTTVSLKTTRVFET